MPCCNFAEGHARKLPRKFHWILQSYFRERFWRQLFKNDRTEDRERESNPICSL